MRNRGRFFIGLALVLVVLVVAGYLIVRQTTARPPQVTVSCVGGSEKSQFMADPEVVRLLKEKHGLTVQWQAMGSYDQVLVETEQIRSRGWNCLWPSSASAQQVFEPSTPASSPPRTGPRPCCSPPPR